MPADAATLYSDPFRAITAAAPHGAFRSSQNGHPLTPYIRNLAVESFRLQRTKRDVPTLAFVMVLVLAAVVITVLPLFRSGRDALLRSQYLRLKPFTAWAALQWLPSMYSYANQVCTSPHWPEPAATFQEGAPPDGVQKRWVNHYPAQAITFSVARANLLRQQDAATLHFYLRSRYRETHLESHYVATAVGGKVRVRLAPSLPQRSCADGR